jgi:hypothetical protein
VYLHFGSEDHSLALSIQPFGMTLGGQL